MLIFYGNKDYFVYYFNRKRLSSLLIRTFYENIRKQVISEWELEEEKGKTFKRSNS